MEGLYIVGQPFPDDRYKGKKDSAVISFQNTSFDVIILIDRPYPTELTDFSIGAFTYGLFEKENVPFMVLNFESMLFDASFNILKLQQDHLKSWLDSEHNAMNLFLVESNTYRLEAIRSIGLHHEFMHDLRGTLSLQSKNFPNMQEVDRKINKIMNNYGQIEMAEHAKKFKIG